MVLDRVDAHVQPFRDAGCGQAFGAEAYHLQLACGEAQFLYLAGTLLPKVNNIRGDIFSHKAFFVAEELIAPGSDGGFVLKGGNIPKRL